jgi:hypothetical protein
MQVPTVLLLAVSSGLNRGHSTHMVLEPRGLHPHKFRLKWGRWDRNRTCNLRLWSLLPFVQGRSGKYTRCLEIAHFDGPKYQEVHKSSPALGQDWGQPSATQHSLFVWTDE